MAKYWKKGEGFGYGDVPNGGNEISFDEFTALQEDHELEEARRRYQEGLDQKAKAEKANTVRDALKAKGFGDYQALGGQLSEQEWLDLYVR